MALSNTAVPRYYGEFRQSVIRGEIPIGHHIEQEMQRIDDLIANPGIWYDEDAINGFIDYCESEMTLIDGSDFFMLPSFKLWAEFLDDINIFNILYTVYHFWAYGCTFDEYFYYDFAHKTHEEKKKYMKHKLY